MYSENTSQKHTYPMNTKRNKNTQFVYTPKTNNKAWSKHLFPEQHKQSQTQKNPQHSTNQISSRPANMNPTLASTYDDTSSLTQPSTWATEFENYKQMMDRDKEETKQDLSSLKTAQNTFMKDVADFRRERQEERKERQEEAKTFKDILEDFKKDRYEMKQDNLNFTRELKDSNLKFKQDMTKQYIEQQRAFLNLQKEVNNITQYITQGSSQGTTIMTVTPQKINQHQTNETETHQTNKPTQDTSTQDTTTTSQQQGISNTPQLTATPLETQQDDTPQTHEINNHDLDAFDESKIFIDQEVEGIDNQEEVQADKQDTISIAETATTTASTNASTSSNQSSLQHSSLKRKVESEAMDLSDGQSSIERSRKPQGPSPNEGANF